MQETADAIMHGTAANASIAEQRASAAQQADASLASTNPVYRFGPQPRQPPDTPPTIVDPTPLSFTAPPVQPQAPPATTPVEGNRPMGAAPGQATTPIVKQDARAAAREAIRAAQKVAMAHEEIKRKAAEEKRVAMAAAAQAVQLATKKA